MKSGIKCEGVTVSNSACSTLQKIVRDGWCIDTTDVGSKENNSCPFLLERGAPHKRAQRVFFVWEKQASTDHLSSTRYLHQPLLHLALQNVDQGLAAVEWLHREGDSGQRITC